MRLRIRPEALADLRAARQWYERRQRGLGHALIVAVDAAFQHIGAQPEVGAEVLPGIRRVLVRRFPYLVFYRRRGDELVVLAVAHAWQSPDLVLRRAARDEHEG